MNLPNRLTLLRIAMIPLFLLFTTEVPGALFRAYPQASGAFSAYNGFVNSRGHIVAGVVFILAFATDAADGYIARKYDMITDFGKFLDPIADKLLVMAALFVLTAWGAISVWIPVLIISREFLVTGLRLLAVNKGEVLAAGGFGKAKTLTQFIAIVLLLFRNFQVAALNSVRAGNFAMYAALALTVLSGADYFFKNKGLFTEDGEAKAG